MNIREIKSEIVHVLKREYQQGMVNMFEGNISVDCGNRILITPSQISKEKMTEDMIIEVDRSGKIIECGEGLKPTTELGMHLKCYELRPDIKAVVHNHSLYATAFAACGRPLESKSLTELQMFFGSVPVVPYGEPGTPQLYERFDKYVMDKKAVLLENHGLLAMGESLELAFSYAEAVEKLAHTLFIAHMIGR